MGSLPGAAGVAEDGVGGVSHDPVGPSSLLPAGRREGPRIGGSAKGCERVSASPWHVAAKPASASASASLGRAVPPASRVRRLRYLPAAGWSRAVGLPCAVHTGVGWGGEDRPRAPGCSRPACPQPGTGTPGGGRKAPARTDTGSAPASCSLIPAETSSCVLTASGASPRRHHCSIHVSNRFGELDCYRVSLHGGFSEGNRAYVAFQEYEPRLHSESGAARRLRRGSPREMGPEQPGLPGYQQGSLSRLMLGLGQPRRLRQPCWASGLSPLLLFAPGSEAMPPPDL